MALISNPTVGTGGQGVCGGTPGCIGGIPTITSFSPTNVEAASGPFTLTVNGTNFRSDSFVSFNSVARTTTFINSTQLTAALLFGDIIIDGTFDVTVTNPTPGCGASPPSGFPVTPIPPDTNVTLRFAITSYIP